jgi:hypothetical protein
MGALFRYLFENGESFAPHSLRIEYKALEGEPNPITGKVGLLTTALVLFP